jgi:hypothetical protein
MANGNNAKEFLRNLQVGINIDDGQPGTGYKTSSFVKYVNNNHEKIYGFFSANHDHIGEVEQGLEKGSYLHLEGFPRLCDRYPQKGKKREDWNEDEKLVHDTYMLAKRPSRTICVNCKRKGNCLFSLQRLELDEMKRKGTLKTVNSPLEFLNRKDVVDIVDEYHFDESIKKNQHYNVGVDCEKLGTFVTETGIGYEYVNLISKCQKEMLRQTSILLTRSSSELMKFTDDNKLNKKMNYENFLRYGEKDVTYLSHYEKLNLQMRFEVFNKHDRYCLYNPRKNQKTTRLIDKAIKNSVEKGEVFQNYVNLLEQLEAIRKISIEIVRRNFGIVVNEKIVVMKNWKPNNVVPPGKLKLLDIKVQEIIKDTKQYQRGFIGDEPYFWNKDKNIYLISKVGKGYDTNEDVPFKQKPDSRFTFGYPLMLDVLSLGINNPINLMDSSYNQIVFDKYEERFFRIGLAQEGFSGIKPRKIERKTDNNKNSVVYKITAPGNQWNSPRGRTSNFSKSYLCSSHGNVLSKKKIGEKMGAFEKWVFPKLKIFIKDAKRQRKRVGVITRLDMEKYFVPLVGKKRVTHFYNQRGTNKFEDVDILIVLGTPFHPPKHMLFNYVMNFAEIPKNTNVITDEKSSMFLRYEDPILQALFEREVVEEIYQAIHRVRPLLYSKIIILFGMVPDKIREELTVRDASLEKCMADISGTKEYYLQRPKESRKKLENLMNYNSTSLAYPEFRDAIQSHKLVGDASGVWKLDEDDTKEIFYDAFEEGMKNIMELLKRWRKKKPLLTNFCRSLRKEVGYNRIGTMLAVAILENIGEIEVKEVSLSTIYKKHKLGKGWLILSIGDFSD